MMTRRWKSIVQVWISIVNKREKVDTMTNLRGVYKHTRKSPHPTFILSSQQSWKNKKSWELTSPTRSQQWICTRRVQKKMPPTLPWHTQPVRWPPPVSSWLPSQSSAAAPPPPVAVSAPVGGGRKEAASLHWHRCWWRWRPSHWCCLSWRCTEGFKQLGCPPAISCLMN